MLSDVENGAGDDTVVGQLLDWALPVYVPDDDFHIGTCRQQVVLVRLLGTPIDVEYVQFVSILKLFERSNLLWIRAAEESGCASIDLVLGLYLVDTKNAVEASSR